MRRDSGDTDERFAAYVRDRGDHHLRVTVLLTGDWTRWRRSRTR
jgi:hypothetical protein